MTDAERIAEMKRLDKLSGDIEGEINTRRIFGIPLEDLEAEYECILIEFAKISGGML